MKDRKLTPQERMDEIKEILSDLSSFENSAPYYKDMSWLIQRVETLERALQTAIAELRLYPNRVPIEVVQELTKALEGSREVG